jgi:hypothetical protein
MAHLVSTSHQLRELWEATNRSSMAPLFWATAAANKVSPGAYDNAVSHLGGRNPIASRSLTIQNPKASWANLNKQGLPQQVRLTG